MVTLNWYELNVFEIKVHVHSLDNRDFKLLVSRPLPIIVQAIKCVVSWPSYDIVTQYEIFAFGDVCSHTYQT